MTEPIEVTPEQVLDYVGSSQPIKVVLPEVRYRTLDAIRQRNRCFTCFNWNDQGDGILGTCRKVPGADEVDQDYTGPQLDNYGRLMTPMDFGCVLYDNIPVNYGSSNYTYE